MARKKKSTLYCICRQPYDSSRNMVQCDGCKEWYHFSCVNNIEERMVDEIAKYFCPLCEFTCGPPTMKPPNWRKYLRRNPCRETHTILKRSKAKRIKKRKVHKIIYVPPASFRGQPHRKRKLCIRDGEHLC